MAQQTLEKKIQNLIGHNETEEAIKLLATHSNEKVGKELAILNSRHKRIKEELTLNVISREEAERGINQVHVGLLNTVHKIYSPEAFGDNPAGASQKKSIFSKIWWLILVPILGLAIYWGMNKEDPSPPKVNSNLNDKTSVEEATKKLTFENGGLKDLVVVEMEITGDEMKGILTRHVGYGESVETYSFKSNTPFKENTRVCVAFLKEQPEFIPREPTSDGSHCWLIGKTIDGKYGLVIPTHGEDYRYEGTYDALGNPIVQYSNYDMFLELKEE